MDFTSSTLSTFSEQQAQKQLHQTNLIQFNIIIQEFTSYQLIIQENINKMNEIFQILIPTFHLDEPMTKKYQDDTLNSTIQHQGLGSSLYRLEISLDIQTPVENSENRILFDQLREGYKFCNACLDKLNGWIDILTDLQLSDNESRIVAVGKLNSSKNHVLEVIEKCKELNVSLVVKGKIEVESDSDDSDDMEFVQVETDEQFDDDLIAAIEEEKIAEKIRTGEAVTGSRNIFRSLASSSFGVDPTVSRIDLSSHANKQGPTEDDRDNAFHEEIDPKKAGI